MKLKRCLKGGLIVFALSVPASLAFVFTGGRWQNGTMTIHTGIAGSAQSGGTFSEAMLEALGAWNVSAFQFEADESFVDPCMGYSMSESESGFPEGDGNEINSIDFLPNVCGNKFGSGVIAITLSYSQNNTLGFEYVLESDIIFNSQYDWDVYSGPKKPITDFRRVALHELGHVLGLAHELSQNSIMAPKIGNLDALTNDDIAGANKLYAEPTSCPIRVLVPNVLSRDSLEEGDCRVQELYSTGSDTSYVDVYRLSLDTTTTLQVQMNSTQLDSVLLITDQQLNPIDAFDDSNGSCDVNAKLTLEAGQYLLLSNTYVVPDKCAGNTGEYALAVSDGPFPILGSTKQTYKKGVLSSALFSGRSRLNSAELEQTSFTAQELITAEGKIYIDPAHVGKQGKIYVLAVLSNGKQYMKTGAGQFLLYKGNVSTLKPVREGLLAAEEDIKVISGLQGLATGLSGLDFKVYLGYSLDEEGQNAPLNIHHSSKPISFSIQDPI